MVQSDTERIRLHETLLRGERIAPPYSGLALQTKAPQPDAGVIVARSVIALEAVVRVDDELKD